MNRILKKMAAILLAAVIAAMPAYGYAVDEVMTPGSTYSVAYSEFYDSKGNSIDSSSDFTDKKFAIAKKTIRKGSNLVKSIKINNRSHDVDIVFTNTNVTAPNGPNVIITDLAVRATTTVKDGGYTIIKSGTVYTYDSDLEFRVGLESTEMEMIRDGNSIILDNNDSIYIKWSGGDSYGIVNVEYGSMATGTGRVYSNDKALYSFSDDIDEELLDRNPNAYLQALDMGSGSYSNGLTLQIYADKGDYIYENDDGQLKTVSALKWNNTDDVWEIKLKRGMNFIISDSKLRSAPHGSESDDDDDRYYDEDEESSSSRPINDYFNPDTGGGSGTVTAVAAVVAITAIAIVSIILSSMVTLKTNKFTKK